MHQLPIHAGVRKASVVRAAIVLAAVIVLAVAVGPVRAEGDVPAQVDSVDLYAAVRTDAGFTIVNLDYADQNNRFVSFDVILIGANSYRCGGFGPDAVVPDLRFIGKDRVELSGSFAPSDFDRCSGAVPEVITFDLELGAAIVVHERSSTVSTVVKGEFPPYHDPNSYKADTWHGRDVLVSGTMNDLPVTSTNQAFFSWSKVMIDTSNSNS